MSNLFKTFKNSNFLFLALINFFIVTYIFAVIGYFFSRKEIQFVLSYDANQPPKALLISFAIVMSLCFLLLLFAVSRMRTWVVIFIHGLFAGGIFYIEKKLGIDSALSKSTYVYGSFLGLTYYIFFGTALWFLVRFRSAIAAIGIYSFIFVSTLFLTNAHFSDTSGPLRTDIFIFLIIYFILISLLLYFENLLKFAKDLNQPAKAIKKGFFAVVILAVLIIAPTIFAINIGVEKVSTLRKQEEQKKIAEELKKIEIKLKETQSQIAALEKQIKPNIDLENPEDIEIDGLPKPSPTVSKEEKELQTEQQELQELEKKKEELQKKQEEPKKEEEKKQQQKSENLELAKYISMIFFGLIGLYLTIYIFIYPIIRLFLIKNKVRKASDQRIKVINSYKLILSIAKWHGVKFKKSNTPTEIINIIEKTYNINLYDLGWIYNRAKFGTLKDEDAENAKKAFEEIWRNRFRNHLRIRGILYFYRLGKIIK